MPLPFTARFRSALIIVPLWLFCAGISSADPNNADPTAERREALEHLLIHDCGSCHGLTLAGGLGSPLTPSVLQNRSASELFLIIRNGLPGTPMPPWSSLLRDEDIYWLVKRLLNGEAMS